MISRGRSVSVEFYLLVSQGIKSVISEIQDLSNFNLNIFRVQFLIPDDFYNLKDNPDGKDIGSPLDDPDDSSDDDNYFVSNAYTFNDNDKVRMEDINTELEVKQHNAQL